MRNKIFEKTGIIVVEEENMLSLREYTIDGNS